MKKTEMIERPVLKLVAGAGLVVRRSSEVLFLPSASGDLLDAYLEAAAGNGLDAITDLCEAREFEVDEFVALDWSSGLRIVAFGDVELTSNQKSLPRLSGVDAGTWVERSLKKIDGAIEIGVRVVDQIEATDLVEGVAQAGGFRLVLSELVELRPAAQPVFRPVQNVESEPSDAEPMSLAEDHSSEPESLPDRRDSEGTELPTGAAVQPVSGEERTSESAALDPVEHSTYQEQKPLGSDGTAAAAFETEGAGAEQVADSLLGTLGGSATVPDPYSVGLDDDTVVPTPEMQAVVDALVTETASPDAGRREQRARWQLRIVDGDTEVVDRALILGRSPELAERDTSETARLVPLAAKKLSRSHLRVTPREHALFLMDLGSTNGSFIVTTGDGQLVKLEQNVERRVDAGTIVQVGSIRFFVESTQ